MAKRNLEFRLGDNVDPFIHAYEAFVRQRCEVLLERLASRLRDLIEANFVGTIVDDLLPASGGPQGADVKVLPPSKDGDGYTITVQNEDAVWVEFGAGVYHNGIVGTVANPYGLNLGFAIGFYGENGAKDTWGFRDESGELRLTHGTPAQMPMYRAVQTLIAEIPQIAQEVFA